jgi:hypothetical protein
MPCSVDTSPTSARATGRYGRWYGALFPAVAALALASVIGSPSASAQDAPDTASIHYKGITLTPGGFFAAEAVYRAHSEEADIGSSYNAIPFDKTSAYNLSEFRGSARQSRLALGVSASPNENTKLSGYWESDFLSSGTSSNSNESNSYTLRIRQFFGQARWSNGFGVSAGQGWTTLTTEKSGVAPRAELIPQTIDAQYVTGFDWARQWQLRGWKGFSDKVWIVGSVEEAQTTVTAHGAPANYLLGQTGGQLLNATQNYSTDLAPDVVAKLVFEPGFGHWELKALGRVFRDRIVNSDTSAIGSYNNHQFGGGVGAGVVFPFNVAEGDGRKRDVFDFGLSALWGAGIGRYGSGSLPDVTIRPNGQIAPIRAAHALLSLESHPARRLDIYGYGGAEYEYRTAFLNGTKGVGYGSPLLSNAGCATEATPTGPYTPAITGTCTGDTRALWMGVVGFWYKFYQGPYGAFQWGVQYTYLTRETWSGAPAAGNPTGPGLAPTAIDPMAFTSVRYYIP